MRNYRRICQTIKNIPSNIPLKIQFDIATNLVCFNSSKTITSNMVYLSYTMHDSQAIDNIRSTSLIPLSYNTAVETYELI